MPLDDRVASVFVLVIGFRGAPFPFISADYKTVLQQAPKAEVAKMLSMGIAKQGLADLQVVNPVSYTHLTLPTIYSV